MMPKYKIYRGFGYVGTDDYDIIDAESLEDAEEAAWQFAVERVESWAEEYNDEDATND